MTFEFSDILDAMHSLQSRGLSPQVLYVNGKGREALDEMEYMVQGEEVENRFVGEISGIKVREVRWLSDAPAAVGAMGTAGEETLEKIEP